MGALEIECSVEMPLRAELGDREEAGEDSANLEEASGEVGGEAGVQEHIEHCNKPILS